LWPSARGFLDETMTADRPVVFGEVLFDCFAEEARLGGAPFNVAWHLRGFGLDPLFISRIGEDKLGAQVVATMERWGMDTSGLQRDPEHPTGRVQVQLQDGQPRYDIVPHQAYDYIAEPAVQALRGLGRPAQLYHGTLAARNAVSEATLGMLRGATTAPVFVDVNLRPPWWDLAKLAEIIQGASCIKLNKDELELLEHQDPDADPRTRAVYLKERAGAEVVLVTEGAAGAFVLTSAGCDRTEAQPVDHLVDTVGAGDGFSAVAILGLLNGWPWQRTLERAAAFSARICGYRGAIREDRGFYEQVSGRWTDG
jgi:fructokinase